MKKTKNMENNTAANVLITPVYRRLWVLPMV
jgi:hypothetical protein